MTISHVKISPPRKSHQLATAEVMLSDDTHTLTIRALRVLKSERGGLWVAEPEHTLPASGLVKYEYQATVEFSPSLRREISEAVIAAFKQKAHAESESAQARKELNV